MESKFSAEMQQLHGEIKKELSKYPPSPQRSKVIDSIYSPTARAQEQGNSLKSTQGSTKASPSTRRGRSSATSTPRKSP